MSPRHRLWPHCGHEQFNQTVSPFQRIFIGLKWQRDTVFHKEEGQMGTNSKLIFFLMSLI